MQRYLSIPLLALLLIAPSVSAQDKPPDLAALARDAGLIFSGTVIAVEHVAPAARGDIGVVRVTFRVRDALRGASRGQTLTIAEWDALWSCGDRYRAGEHLLLFLYPPSGELGLTTTVGGNQGRISLADSKLTIAEVARQISNAVADDDGHSSTSAPASRQPRRLE